MPPARSPLLIIYSLILSLHPLHSQYTRCANWYQGGRIYCSNIQNSGLGYGFCDIPGICEECMDGAACLGGSHQKCIFPAGGQCYMEDSFGPITDYYDFISHTQYYYQYWQCASVCLDTQPCNVCTGRTYLKDCAGTNPGICAACSKCGPGTAYVDGCTQFAVAGWPYDTICSDCPKGKYSDLVDNTATGCTQCPAGSTTIVTGATVCVSCGPGFSFDSSGQCAACLPGSYSPLGDPCLPCPISTYIANSSASTCIQCLPGKYTTMIGSIEESTCLPCLPGSYRASGQSCLPCPYSTYNPDSSASTCIQCPQGTFITVLGSTDLVNCSRCSPGWYSANGQTCQACPASRYSTNFSSSTCTQCPAGKYTGGVGSTDVSSCIPCTPGWYFPGSISYTGCYRCYYTSYSTGSGSSVCTLCAGGGYIGVWGSTNSDQCKWCLEGQYYFPATTCKNCAAGQYSTQIGLTYCLNCAAGQYSSMYGATYCFSCPAGTYSADVRRTSSCLQCPAGKYSSVGASVCTISCPAGSFLATPDLCSICPIGTYSSKSFSTLCVQCPAGTYSLQASSTLCILCSAGMYSSQLSSTLCTQCSVGTYSPQAFSTCIQCPAGTYSLLPASTSCSSCGYCPAGAYALACGGDFAGICTQCTL